LLGRQKGGVIMHPSLIRREIDPAGRCARRNGHTIGGQTGDDGGGLQPARHRLAIGVRQGMRAGLIGDLPRRQPPAHRFGKAEDMMRARARHAQFRARRAIGLPGQDQRLGPVMPQDCGAPFIAVDMRIGPCQPGPRARLPAVCPASPPGQL
jgi:hypothetical protein